MLSARTYLPDEDGTISLPAVLHDKLYHIVTIAVLYKLCTALSQLLQDNALLRVRTVFKDALYDSAAVRVGWQLFHTPLERVYNKLREIEIILGFNDECEYTEMADGCTHGMTERNEEARERKKMSWSKERK